MSVKINSLEIENVKRIKAVKLEPSANGLTIIGGNNNQGKTSVLDAIAWALGGDKYKPTAAARDGAYTDPILHVELSNGLIVERKGKNSSLKVIDPHGNKAGQQLLNSFLSALALDLPKFMHASDKEKAAILLQIIGIGDQLAQLEAEESRLYNQRTAIGRIADQKQKYASELQCWENVPSTPVSASELLAKQQAILARNGENQRKRENAVQYAQELTAAQAAYDAAKKRLEQAEQNARIAQMSAQDLQDESTAELEKSIAEIDAINMKIRDNLNKEHAEEEAKTYRQDYEALTKQISVLRKEKQDLLQSADLPLEGLTVENGALQYHGKQWDSMSGSEQLRVATAIVRKLNPDCGFVLLDKLEQMDSSTLQAFGQWLEQEGLQAIATRVSTGEECSIIIEDGYSVNNQEQQPKPPTMQKTWTKGVFQMDFQETNGIQTGSGIKLVIYGQEGVGKSSLAAQLPGAVFLDCEGSTSKMNVRRLPKPTSWEMLQQELQFVLESHVQRQYQTVVIDTFDWAERLAIAQLCSKHNVNGIEGFGYGKGWEYEAEEIGRFLDSTERLIQAGIHVALLCHAITRKASLPEVDAEYDHWELKLGNKTTNKIAPLLKEWSDITLFLAFQTHVIATGDKGKKHKATACNRVMYTTKTAWWDAKNRFGLPEMLPLEYASIASLFATTPAPAPVSKAQQLVEQAQAAGLPTEQDFATATPIVTTPDSLDGIFPQLAQLMEANHVSPEELQQVVGEKGYFPADMPVNQYPQDFVEGWCIPWWKNIFDMIQQNRNVPF